jgi:hypothetical protein
MSVGLSRQGAIARLDAVREDIGRLEGPSALDDLRAGRRRDL